MKTTFVIDRSKWRCGTSGRFRKGIGFTYLCNAEGFQCCLGQIAIQLGLDERSCLRLTSPEEVAFNSECITGVLIYSPGDTDSQVNTAFAEEALRINDNTKLNDTQRERALERLAEEYGLRIEFAGEYVTADEQ